MAHACTDFEYPVVEVLNDNRETNFEFTIPGTNATKINRKQVYYIRKKLLLKTESSQKC